MMNGTVMTTDVTIGDIVNGMGIRIETGRMEEMTDEETSVSILVATEEMKDVEKNRELLLKPKNAAPLLLHSRHRQLIPLSHILAVTR